ncbi:MAG: transcription initiation factor IIB family protein [Candidatus Hadarchaeales archaeon]
MKCPSCGSLRVVEDATRGERICTSCGLVLMEHLVHQSLPYSEGEEPTGFSELDVALHDLGLGTTFRVGRDLPPSERARLRRMRFLHERSRAVKWHERSLREALIQVERVCEDLSLPGEIRREMSQLYRRCRKEGLTKGQRTGLLSASLAFVVCRLRGLPRTEREVVRVLVEREGMGEGEALRGLRRVTKMLMRRLNLKLPPSSPRLYVDRFASQLHLPAEVVRKAHELCAGLERSGKPANLVAAALLYNAAREMGVKLTLREVAREVGVGVSSLCRLSLQGREPKRSQGG